MNATEKFLAGKLPEESGAVPKHIVTAISNIFVFKDRAYKIYRSDSDFFNANFNDLSKKDIRFSFTRKDFEWNNRLSPEIYLEIKGIRSGDELALGEPADDAEELVIVMNTVDMSNQVLRKLIDGQISEADCFEIGKQFGERVRTFEAPKSQRTVYEDFASRHKDLEVWTASVSEIPQEEAQAYLAFMKDFLEAHRSELDTTKLMGVCVDVHADNALFMDGQYIPIDTYSPKEAWLQGYKHLNVYRAAADMYVFIGRKGFENVLKGYEEAIGEKLNPEYEKFMITYCELIMWPYQFMLAGKEPWRIEVAQKHREFLKMLFA